MGWPKSKSISERAEDERAKLELKRINLAKIQVDAATKSERERMQSIEMRRLKA